MKARWTGVVLGVLACAGCGGSSGTNDGAARPTVTDDGGNTQTDAGAPDDGGQATDATVADATPTDAKANDATAASHAIVARIALTPDGDHVTFPTQNGSTVNVAIKDLVGKTVYWVTTPGGDPVSNAAPIDVGSTTIADDLTSTFTTPAHNADGAYEVACVVSLTNTPPPHIPAAGDLAAFDNTAPPAGEPPATGVSVRVHVAGADGQVALTNRYFIRFGTR